MREEHRALRDAAARLLFAIESFERTVSANEPNWDLGGRQIWDVDEAHKALMAAAWEYDRMIYENRKG
jgi:hypothetical protein